MPHLKYSGVLFSKGVQMARFRWIDRLLSFFRIQDDEPETDNEYDYEDTPRDDNMNTEPQQVDKASDYLDDWKMTLASIYNDTINYCDGWRNKGYDSEERQARYMAYQSIPRLDATYNQILSLLDQMVAQLGEERTAQAIARDVELDYVIALVFVPPSDVINEMSMTLEQLQGVFNRIATTQ